MKVVPLAIALTVAFPLAGCQDNSPVISAQTSTGAKLSQPQVAALNDWLRSHPSGWGLNFATPPAPSLVLRINQESGRNSTLELWDEEGWRGAIVIDDRLAQFRPEDIAELRSHLMEPAPL